MRSGVICRMGNYRHLEGLNGLFQAARTRARGYRNTKTFATMIYLIAAPLGDFFQSTWSKNPF